MDKVDSARVSGLLGWLEEEQHQTKAQLGRFQYQVEQLTNLTREQAGQIRAAQEELSAARNQLGRLSSLDELVRQVRETLARLQSTHAEHLQENDKDDRAWQTEVDRTRQAISEIWLRIDAVYKEFEPLLGRTQAMSDATKRHQEAIAQLFKGVDGLDKQSESLMARLQIAAEQGRRNESEIDRISRQWDTLRGQDEVTTARVQIVADKLKQIDERIAQVLAEEQLRVDLAERLQVARLEQQRVEKQVAELIPMIDIHGVRLDEQAREIRQVEDRRRLTADDLAELKQLLQEHVARLEGYVVNVEELEERHKRRQVMELELQANELKDRIVKLKGQVR